MEYDDNDDDDNEYYEGVITTTTTTSMMITMSFENLCVQKEVDKLWECGCFCVPRQIIIRSVQKARNVKGICFSCANEIFYTS